MLRVEKITKFYRNHPAIHDLSFNVNKGEILGIAGPNGSGKTTLLRIIATLLTPTCGHIYFQDFDKRWKELLMRQQIGYMPEDASHYLRLNAIQNLSFHLSFYDIDKTSEKIELYLKMFDLWKVRKKSVGQFSKGMKQKLLFIRAIIHDPALLLLDEPFTSLDPTTRNTCKLIIRDLRAAQMAIIISSHSLADLAILCDHILFLKEGKQIQHKSMKTLQVKLKETGTQDVEACYLKLMEEK